MPSTSVIILLTLLLVCSNVYDCSASWTTQKPYTLPRVVKNGWWVTTTTRRTTTTPRPTFKPMHWNLPNRRPVDREYERQMEIRRGIDSIQRAWERQQQQRYGY